MKFKIEVKDSAKYSSLAEVKSPGGGTRKINDCTGTSHSQNTGQYTLADKGWNIAELMECFQFVAPIF